ncbi:threonylcarbamoyl-AMP synthase [candidate division KSB1 bacterium]|nr:threonylcarbamoyl-AMP synthase [candidate division KSB1 bacterium]
MHDMPSISGRMPIDTGSTRVRKNGAKDALRIIQIDPITPEDRLLQEAADVIHKGGIIAYPTETVYGIGANALNEEAIERVYAVKQRDRDKPMLIIIHHIDQLNKLVDCIPHTAEILCDSFWPGPLTLVFRASSAVNPRLLGRQGNIGIRIPKNTICLKLLERCTVPLTSTSANISGAENPISIDQVYNSFKEKIDLYIDGGIASGSMPSTVLDMTTTVPTIRRKGRITQIEIETIIGKVKDGT